jgi:hypothetical protein
MRRPTFVVLSTLSVLLALPTQAAVLSCKLAREEGKQVIVDSGESAPFNLDIDESPILNLAVGAIEAQVFTVVEKGFTLQATIVNNKTKQVVSTTSDGRLLNLLSEQGKTATNLNCRIR